MKQSSTTPGAKAIALSENLERATVDQLSAMSQAGSSFEPGQTILEKYLIERVIGTGGMGLVLLAVHLQLDERVAIKVLRDDIRADDEVRQRFLREAQAAVKLKSENVARILDVGTLDSGAPYMVMEFLEGDDLDTMILRNGKIDPDLACDLVVQACVGLAEAHSRRIVHRDVKPSNLFVTRRPDGSPLVKVLDFGISKAPGGSDVRITQTQSVLGTPAYMSPEQMRSTRDVDARTDVWSLGMVLYEAIEGQLPYAGENFLEIALRITSESIPPLQTKVVAGLEQAIMACLQKDREHRLGSMYEVACALGPFCRDPVQAQVSIDRIAGMLGRGSRSLTPVPGVPVVAARTPTTPTSRLGAPIAVDNVAATAQPKRSSRSVRIFVVAAGGLLVAMAAFLAFKLVGADAIATPDTSGVSHSLAPDAAMAAAAADAAALEHPAVVDAGVVTALADAQVTEHPDALVPSTSPPVSGKIKTGRDKRVRKDRGSGSGSSGQSGSGGTSEPPDPFDRFKTSEQ